MVLAPHIVRLVHDVGLELLPVSAGTFLMGTPEAEEDRDEDETQHEVTLTQPFYLGKYPVTQAQWRAVIGTNLGRFRARDFQPSRSLG